MDLCSRSPYRYRPQDCDGLFKETLRHEHTGVGVSGDWVPKWRVEMTVRKLKSVTVFVLTLGSALLLSSVATACRSSGSASPTRCATLAPAAFTVPTKSFSSAVLGVSFRYPTSWRRGVTVQDDHGGVSTSSLTAEADADVSFVRLARHESPLPFRDAGNADLSRLRLDEGGEKVLRTGLVRIDGLCLAEIEYIDDSSSPADAWHWITAVSAGEHQNHGAIRESVVNISVGCQASEWSIQRDTLNAILASALFARPKGLGAGRKSYKAA